MSTCPACGAEATEGARFCSACGLALGKREEPVPGAGVAFKRILTLIFVDLVGSTELAAADALEDYDATLTRYHAICSDTIRSHGGSTLALQGDGVLACFGLSDDGENAALSAVAAARAMVVAIPAALPGVNARVGIHSGTVLCRMQADGGLLPNISGLDVNITSRIQNQASPGGVVLSRETLDFVSRIATVPASDIGEVRLKGVPVPMRLYELEEGELQAPEDAVQTLYERAETVALLTGATPVPDGLSPNVTMMIGPAGIGKSAVLGEISRRLGNTHRLIDLSSRLNLRHTPLYPVAEWLARALGYARFPLDPDADRAEFAARLRTLVPGLGDMQEEIAADLMGLAAAQAVQLRYAAPQLRALRIGTMADLVAHLMAAEPVLLSFDDYHWVDEDSHAFVGKLLERGVPERARVVLTARPGSDLGAFATTHGLHVIRLEALSVDAVREMLAGLGSDGMDAAEADRVTVMAEGNPLFLRTLLNLYRRRGEDTAGRALPPTIEATFQGFVNSFGPLRDLVLRAAVIGRGFTAEELSWIAGRGDGLDHDQTHDLAHDLGELAGAGVIEPTAGGGWQFSHILLQEAAYNMIPGSQRRGLHGQVAAALTENDPQRVAAVPEIVADHAIASEDPGIIAGSCVQAGASFLQRAGFDRSIHYLDAALAALGQLGPAAEGARLTALSLLAAARVQRLGFAHPDTVESYRLLEAEAGERGAGGPEHIMALYGLFAHRMMSGDVRRSAEIVDEMLRVADPADPQQQVLCLVNVSAQALYSGRLDDKLAATAELEKIYDTAQHGTLFLSVGADPLVAVKTGDANVHGLRGDVETVRRLTRESLAHVDRIGAILQRPWVKIFNGSAMAAAGQMDEALDMVVEGTEIADQQGAAFWSLNGRIWQEVLGFYARRPDAGGEPLAALVEQCSAIGIGLNRPFFRCIDAASRFRRGGGEEALAMMQDATRELARSGQRQWAPEAWRLRAWVHWKMGDPVRARRCLGLALDLARFSGATMFERRILAQIDATG
ncbi:ATP-binding protein [Pukyongiella litopenaei]|uniref:AAA family ATPase n=1 Tax=Pukyongiella litopenaei TaxID=2605946 RepID=A0A2S0MLN6_9RHOB|nr:adenylate/guanylate cyclase domain-containing protein [Pukyongiella litopenaei]AVO36737.1 AAA family ATPase [Pukyongiella litopenaei]